MAKFKVGDRVRCAMVDLGFFAVKEDVGTVRKIDEERGDTYCVLCDHAVSEWWYNESYLTHIKSRITTIEWFTPSECLPYEGADVYFIADDGHYAGKFYGNKNLFSVSLCYGNGDNVEFHDNEVLFWAYAPEVK